MLAKKAQADARAPAGDSSRGGPCLIFELGEHSYGLATENVLEIAPFQALSVIPGRQEQFMGYLNLRGELIPVVQPHVFNAADDPSAPSDAGLHLNCLVIVGIQKKSFALPVTRIASVATLSAESEQEVRWRPRTQEGSLEIFYVASRPVFLLKADLILGSLLTPRRGGLADG